MSTTSYRNQELHDALQAYTSRALETLNAEVDVGTGFGMEELRWVAHEDKMFKQVQDTRVLWGLAITLNHKLLHGLPEYQELQEVLQGDPVVARQMDTLVGTSLEMMRLDANQISNAIAFRIVHQRRAFEFDTGMFESEYIRLEEFFWSEYIEYESLNVLYGFTAPKHVELDDNLAIVPLSDAQICDLLDMDIAMGYKISVFVTSVARFAIRARWKLPKVVGEARDEEMRKRAHEIIRRNEQREEHLIEILRLFKTGPVYSVAAIRSRNSFFSSGNTFSTNKEPQPSFHNKYELSNEDLPQLRELWRQSNKDDREKKRRFLAVALRRFSQARDRTDSEDTVIDLLICAEALFLTGIGKARGELSYRLSQRAAFFVEQEPAKRIRAFKFMKRMYGVRSEIVHGTDAPPKLPAKEDGTKYTLEECCAETEEYLRRALKKAIAIVQDPTAPKFLIDWESLIFQLEP